MQVPIKVIKETALKCLYSTEHDEEQRSYVFKTEDNNEFWYYAEFAFLRKE